MSHEQSLTMDYVKAFGMIFVLVGHINNDIFNVYYAYLFHMPLFFFIGGVLYKDTRSITNFIAHVIKKQLPYLIITYLIIGAIALLINVRYGIHTGDAFSTGLYETAKLAIKSNFHNNKMFLTGWFLFAYIFVSILSVLIIKSIKRVIVSNAFLLSLLVAISVLLVTVSITYLSPQYILMKDYKMNFICQVLTGMSFYIFGYVIRNQIYNLLNFYVFILLTVILYISKGYGFSTQTIMSWSYYPDGLIMSIINALIGIYAVFFISLLITRGTKEIKLIKMIGQNSRTIMAYHLLVYVILDVIASILGDYSLTGTDVYDNHFITKWSVPVYIALGLLLPLIFSFIKQKVIGMMKLSRLLQSIKS
ncbi:acyltransferase family protein [Citrobacter freundii]|uniref:acyltransferase family protein n=2 Tax=Enterobacteriaceae TaxID=543 RepID=UPI002E115714|nr:acyltransferase family protein [Citrobacter freundii]